jgi:predicted RND superfamily exporter protein
VIVGTFTDAPLIEARRVALGDAAVNLTTATAGAGIDRISVSGEPITFRNTLDSFTRAMLLTLPLALVLAFLIAALAMRSAKYALVSVAPILLVVAWLYGYMYLVGYTITMVTATIAAISIGIGIDFATHFTVRFRDSSPDPGGPSLQYRPPPEGPDHVASPILYSLNTDARTPT